ncbi:HFR028Wp [Eremothecium sinecaudum]|uniref:HFR028Wp n=1 Tax=Eremothecium sinecaudum TaxID=45286 RepID=A0A109V013_9SACH|nr:HFR028Wp [Eremothecium sinecaudum]AMD21883.1 HFR028Wp [Eremothecium sinecaudum]
MSTQTSKNTTEAGKNRPQKQKEKGPAGGQLVRLTDLVKTLQFAWFAGHLTVLVMGSLYILSVRGSSRFHQALYSLLYLGVLESFGIIVYQHHYNAGSKQPGKGFTITELIQDENFLYCLLAMLWLFTPRFLWTVPPFFIFSLFHALTYIKNVILPVVFQADDKNSLVQLISRFLRENHDKSLSWSCTSELLCYVVVIFRALAFRPSSWIVFVLYSIFIKARYERSANMKTVVRKWEARVDGLVSHPQVPPALKRIYASSKMYISKLGNYAITRQSVPPSKQN